MALGAPDRLRKPYRADCTHAVGEHSRLIIFGLGAALLGCQQQAVECGSDLLFESAVGEQVAGKLLNGELVKPLVLGECLDDVVAVRPDVAGVVRMISDCVREAHYIQPWDGHPFPEMW